VISGDIPAPGGAGLGGQQYNHDLLVIETGGTHWIVEVKINNEMTSADVQAKREAAKRWANYVTADASVGTTWRYLLVSESDVGTAKGSWPALKKLGSYADPGYSAGAGMPCCRRASTSCTSVATAAKSANNARASASSGVSLMLYGPTSGRSASTESEPAARAIEAFGNRYPV